jgi:hypothetical protein
MTPLSDKHMEEALIMVGPRYEEEMTEEIDLMTKVINLNKAVKTYEGQHERGLKLLS